MKQNRRVAGFDHAGTTSGCDKCHTETRPAGLINGFDHSQSGGQGDCASCHSSGIGTSWAGGRYSHSPAPRACINCHSADMPEASVGAMNHALSGLPDCASCHQKNLGVSWSGGVFNHSPAPSSCISCHASQRPPGAVGNPAFDHAQGGMGDCVSCHRVNIGQKWNGGQFSHTPAPSTCTDCHGSSRPIGPVGSNPSFDHKNDGMGDCVSCHTKNLGSSWSGGTYSHSPAPTSCANCHNSELPTGVVSEMAHSHAGLPDCASCHQKNLGVNWTGGNYAHSTATTSCQDCHGAQRPSGAVGSPAFDHKNAGMGDCVSCHTKNIGTNWSGASYSHSPAPTSCASCHASELPSGAVGNPPFDHKNGGTGDCVSCHAKNAGTTWAGGTFSHSPAPASCTNCHSAAAPTGVTHEMAHSYPNLGDCAACHKNNVGVNWTGGSYSHSPSPATCQECHGGQRPAQPVGTPAFDHSHGGTGDCAACHKKPGLAWTGGLFSHSPVPASCNECHEGGRPATATYPDNGGTVQGHYTTSDCYACHLPESTTVTSFTFSHVNAKNQKVTTCLPCHLKKGQQEHGANVKDCVSCHNSTQRW